MSSLLEKVEKRPAVTLTAGYTDGSELALLEDSLLTPTYEDVAQILARYVYNVWYREETWADDPSLKTFDTMCSPALKLAARVLTKLNILAPVDQAGRRAFFICEPSEFRKRTRANKAAAFDFDTLVLAAVALAEYDGPREAGLLSCLIRLGLCKPIEFKTKNLAKSGIRVTDFELA